MYSSFFALVLCLCVLTLFSMMILETLNHSRMIETSLLLKVFHLRSFFNREIDRLFISIRFHFFNDIRFLQHSHYVIINLRTLISFLNQTHSRCTSFSLRSHSWLLQIWYLISFCWVKCVALMRCFFFHQRSTFKFFFTSSSIIACSAFSSFNSFSIFTIDICFNTFWKGVVWGSGSAMIGATADRWEIARRGRKGT